MDLQGKCPNDKCQTNPLNVAANICHWPHRFPWSHFVDAIGRTSQHHVLVDPNGDAI